MKNRFKFIKQDGETECGLCSLAMIMTYYNCEYSMMELRNKWLVGRDGMSMLDLKRIASEYGFIAKGAKLNNIYDISYPCILYINNNHFVVLEKIAKNKFYVADPAVGTYVLSESEFRDLGAKIYLAVYPGDNSIVRKLRKNKVDYINVIKNNMRLITGLVVLSIIVQLITLGIPIAIKEVMNSIFTDKLKVNNTIILMLIIIFLAYIFLNYIKSRLSVILQARFQRDISIKYVKDILHLPFSFFKIISSSDLVHRYNGSIVVKEILSEKLISFWLDIGTVFISLGYLFYTSASVGIVMTICGLIELSISIKTIRKKKYLLGKEILTQSSTLSEFMNLINSVDFIKFKSLEESSYSKWNKKFENQLKSMIDRGNYVSIYGSIIGGMSFFFPLLSILLSLSIYNSHGLSIGDVLSLYMISANFIAPFSKVVSYFDEIIYADEYFNRMTEIGYLEKENIETGVNINRESSLSIKLENISFKYGINSDKSLDNIDLSIDNGEFIAIVGKTGCGKSTLGLMSLGYYEPTEGDIYYNGINSKDICKKNVRQQFGVVSQNNFIFNQSILDNIIWGREKANMEEVINACKLAEIYDDIMDMPMGFHTHLSENGSNISGGQKQRIAIARALIDSPKVLLLDESTSALDINTEKKITSSFEKLNSTRIVITHRLNTIVNANKIVVMDKGKIVAMGTHKELMNTNAYYRNMYTNYMNEYNQGPQTETYEYSYGIN